MENESLTVNLVDGEGRLRTQRKTLARVKKKSEFLANLITNLDTLVYVELCIIYYMDCSLFRLLLRLFNQIIFFTPKPVLVRPAPQKRPYLGAIFIPGITCILLHIFSARSEAGESMRGYLHGGIIIDLIGQKAPTSTLHLLSLDVLLLLLQCLMLAVSTEKERLQTILTALTSLRPDPPISPSPDALTAQDHDAEERGIFRHPTATSVATDMPNLARADPRRISTPPVANEDNAIRQDEAEERDGLLTESLSRVEDDDDEALELFWSGMTIVADFHILHCLKRQLRDYGNATGMALQTVGYSAEMAAITANRRINAATVRLQQGVLSPRNT
ncbi:hypothetical protein K3495_g4126 [Podosphaera aphanis]|nr:hypothetical protein K3495_g4126 [Podosphaera aphanis]